MTNARLVATIAAMSLISSAVLAGLGSKDAMYVDGTWTKLKPGVEGKLDTGDGNTASFVSKEGTFQIPYANVTSLEYGQKAGRRVGATIALGVTTLGLGALPMLFSKKRKHYFSIGWKDADGKDQGVVLELGKDVTRGTLKVFEVRSGKKVEYESEDAKAHIGN